MGKPVKIVDFNKNGALEFKENELQKILCNNKVKDKKVCLLSVAGVFRGGKSLLLDFFLRYLQRGGSEDWLLSDDEKLDGFCWKGGCERVTTGIWVWNELFTLPFSPEVEIMLMDTQGLFDNETNMKGSATVFSLSTIVSCIQIYNLSKKITAADLDHLHLFTEYGRLVENKVSGTPFQSLVFLVRDWPNQHDYRFGKEGGKRYLKTILSSRNDAELQAVRDHITKCFENIDCFLMPHPGLAVEEKSFQGQLKDIRDEFQNCLRQLVSMVISSEGLVNKKNNGKDVTCEGLFMIFQTYVDVFKSGELPSPKSLFLASAELNNREAFENCQNSFLEQMENDKRAHRRDKERLRLEQLPQESIITFRDILWFVQSLQNFGGTKPYVEENELENKFMEIKSNTLKQFRQARKMDMLSLNKKFEYKLESEMHTEYEKYKRNNSHKNGWFSSIIRRFQYAVATVSARSLFDKSLDNFLEQMEEHFGGDQPYVEEIELENKYIEIRDHTLTLFRDAKKMNVSSINKNFEDKLTSRMQDECEKYKKNNRNKKGWAAYMWKGMKYAVLGFAACWAMVFGGPATFATLFVSAFPYLAAIWPSTRRSEATANNPRPIPSNPSMMGILRSAVILVVLITVVWYVWSNILPIIIVALLIIFFVLMFKRVRVF